MFKNFLSFWKGKDFLNEILDDFNKMGEDTERMYTSVIEKMFGEEKGPGLKDMIYETDKRVNELEREIRRRIVEHLSIQPTVDVAACLLMMSVVKDAERLGDYCKNLYEVTELLKGPRDNASYDSIFGNLHEKIIEEFTKTRKAFQESDEAMAKEVLAVERTIVHRCDAILVTLAQGNLDTNSAVCYTLTARYFKRIAAHLANIGSSVILPLSDLDFFDEKTRHGKEPKKKD